MYASIPRQFHPLCTVTISEIDFLVKTKVGLQISRLTVSLFQHLFSTDGKGAKTGI